MPERKLPDRSTAENQYDLLTVLNANALENGRQRNGNYVIPDKSTVLVSGRLKDDPTKRVDLGMLTLDLPVDVRLIGSGTSTKEGLIGEKLGFFELDLESFPLKSSQEKVLSNLEKFYFIHNSFGNLKVSDYKPDEVEILVLTVKLRGHLSLR